MGFSDFDEEQKLAIILTSRLISAISAFGTFLVILTFLIFKSYKSFPLLQIFFLCIAEFFYHISSFIPTDINMTKIDASCITKSIFRIYFEFSSIIWTYLIAFTALLSISLDPLAFDQNRKRYLIIFNSVANIVPAIFTLM